jgi:hypothetical protein
LPLPPAESTREARAEYGIRLLGGLRQLDAWLRHERPPLAAMRDALANTETYMADCAAHGAAWWCAVWRFGDLFCPPNVGSGRGQKTSYQTLVFWACLKLRLHVRRAAIATGDAPDWNADERPQDFAWLRRHQLVLRKDPTIGCFSLAELNQALYALLIGGWHTCAYHEELRRYAGRLLDRMAFLLLHAHPADVLDDAGFCQRVGQHRAQRALWEAAGGAAAVGVETAAVAGAAGEQHSVRHAADRAARSRTTFYAVNFDCVYLCQLRYWKITRVLHVEALLERVELPPRLTAAAQPHTIPSVETVRALVVHRAGHLHAIFSAQLAAYYVQHVVAPEDKHWVAYLAPTANTDGTSIIEQQHDRIAAQLIAETRRPVAEWVVERGALRAAFAEYAVLQVFGQLLPPDVDFFDRFVVLDEEFETRLQGLTLTTRPHFVQLFSRFHVVHRQRVFERPSIYDALVLWLQIIAVDFPDSRLWTDCLAPFWRETLGLQNDDAVPDIVFT